MDMQEYKLLQREPLPHIQAHPNPTNILEWHYVIQGPPGTDYEGAALGASVDTVLVAPEAHVPWRYCRRAVPWQSHFSKPSKIILL